MKTWLLCCALVLAACVGFAESPARRVVSLAPSLTELIFDAGWGDRLIARSDACDFPPEALALPVAGSFGRPNVEWLLREKPDLVVSTDLERPGLAQTLRAAGIEYQRLPCEGWEQMLDAVRKLGVALGDEAGAAAWVDRAQHRRDALASRASAYWAGKERPRVYFEVWSDPLTTPGRESFVTDLISLAGGRSIGAALREPYAHVSAEWVLSEKPDVIVLAYMIPQAEPSAAFLARRPGWKSLGAVKRDAICATIPSDWLLRPGPRWLQGAEALADFLESHDRADKGATVQPTR
ncbi:MAG: ABC transporter substrate-binding protein [Kiritimatiellae bacterium]|nr:ABC transporter substrate-binding protein [Kiritimatiellia bacterium]